MLVMLKDLILHKGYANAALLKAIQQNKAAAHDPELRTLLHHIIVANRFWLSLILDSEFDADKERQVPDSLDGIVSLYQEAHEQELEWIAQVQESDLERTVESGFLPGASFSVGQVMIQVCMHSTGHRAQCSSRLRGMGGSPPAMDFILWLNQRPAADWSSL
ncbi:MAG: DinB family protein [Blastocatellia bacterium]